MADYIDRIKELRAMSYPEYLQTPEWRERRAQAILAAGGKCQLCNKDTDTLHVHHRTYDRRGCELPSDLTALCGDCHEAHHEAGGGTENENDPQQIMYYAGYYRGVVRAYQELDALPAPDIAMVYGWITKDKAAT